MGAQTAVAAAKSKVHAARQAGKADPVDATRTLASAGAASVAKDMDSAVVQAAIENPETRKIILDLSDLGWGEREITIRTAFSYADINDRRVLADLESFGALVVWEMSRHGVGVGDPKWIEKQRTYLGVVACQSMLRDKANAILAKISEYTQPWTTRDEQGRDVMHRTPTPDELLVGLSSDAAAVVAGFLVTRCAVLQQERAARKNSLAAGA